MKGDRNGFTIVEVVLAIVILAFGILVLSSSAVGITRMIDSGQGKTRAAALAASRLEQLRGIAAATTPPCQSVAFTGGTATYPGGFTEEWTITGSGRSRLVQSVIRYRNGTRPQTDTLLGRVLC